MVKSGSVLMFLNVSTVSVYSQSCKHEPVTAVVLQPIHSSITTFLCFYIALEKKSTLRLVLYLETTQASLRRSKPVTSNITFWGKYIWFMF